MVISFLTPFVPAIGHLRRQFPCRMHVHPHFLETVALNPSVPECANFGSNLAFPGRLLFQLVQTGRQRSSAGDLHKSSEPGDDVQIGQALQSRMKSATCLISHAQI